MNDLFLYVTPEDTVYRGCAGEQGSNEIGLSQQVPHLGKILLINYCSADFQCREAPSGLKDNVWLEVNHL
jgi:hypothetical protein